jgi:signal transduction histidine kinase
VGAGQLSTRVPTHDGFASDDLDELGGAFNVMLDRLEELIRQVKQVSSDIAHDLRTPLSRVRQRLDKLRRSEDDAQARLRAINLIEANLDEVLSMFAALLRLAEIECEGPSGRDGPIDLSGLVQRMAETYTPDIETRGGALTVAVKPVAIRGDAGLITLAIANLLDNVLRHTPPDTAVRMCFEEKNGLAILSVGDGGPGVPEQYREMVLRRHWRLAPHRPGSSSGLGLAIVAAIARRHRARLTLTDACPGLTVTLAFTVEPLT